MKKLVVFLLCFCSVFAFFGCKTRKDDLSVLGKDKTFYNIQIDLDVDEKQAVVKQTVDYVNETESILKVLEFNLYPQFFLEGATHNVIASTKQANCYYNGMSYAEFEIKRVCVFGKDVAVKYEGEFDEILVVDMNKSLMPNERITIQIDYFFKLPNCCHRFGYGENTINLANFYPVLCVFENGDFVNNGYSPNGDPFYSEVSNYCVSITLPNEYIVASTGEKESENLIDNRKKTTYSAYMVRDFALVVSNKFQILTKMAGDVSVNYYYFSDLNFEQSLQTGVDAINTFSTLFGAYPYSTYCIVQTDFVHGGMEYPGLVMISRDIDHLDDYKNVIVHETAHQWWYGVVGNDEMNEPWLDEALTEFSTALFYDYNNYNLTHKQMVETAKDNYTLFVSVYQDVLGKIDTSMRGCKTYGTEPEYTYCVYVKGLLMFESLYNLVGNEKFISSLQNYFNVCKFKNASRQNLIDSFETVCKSEFDNFFASWLNGKVVIR